MSFSNATNTKPKRNTWKEGMLWNTDNAYKPGGKKRRDTTKEDISECEQLPPSHLSHSQKLQGS